MTGESLARNRRRLQAAVRLAASRSPPTAARIAARKSSGRVESDSRRRVHALVVVMSTSRTSEAVRAAHDVGGVHGAALLDHDDLGLAGERRAHGVGLGDVHGGHDDTRLGGEHPPQPFAHEGMAVEDEDPHLVR